MNVPSMCIVIILALPIQIMELHIRLENTALYIVQKNELCENNKHSK